MGVEGRITHSIPCLTKGKSCHGVNFSFGTAARRGNSNNRGRIVSKWGTCSLLRLGCSSDRGEAERRNPMSRDSICPGAAWGWQGLHLRDASSGVGGAWMVATYCG